MMDRSAMLTLLIAAAWGSNLWAQTPATASGTQDLQFGVVLPGLVARVSRLDAMNCGRYDIRGAKDAEVRIDLQLPTALVASDGTLLPLAVSAGDGGYTQVPNVRAQQAFDPNAPLIARFGRSGRLYLWLGGAALPAPTQPSGDYSATISLTVAYTGT